MINLIPLPSEYTMDGRYLVIDEITVSSQLDLPLLKCKSADNALVSILEDLSLEDEEYRLIVDENGVKIYASSRTGAYYGLQSLRQLSRYELGVRRIPYCTISDKPKYKWRGLQIDESRHFFGKEEIKRFLDNMFMLKLNVFHWHLTDDTGWRIEIKKYPLLTEIGSVRDYTHINGWHSTDIINEKYSGFYTQEDIREIVEYAAERSITVVPEIDFPAHSAAALAAYPWLACRELNRDVPGYFGSSIPVKKLHQLDWNRTICLGKDKAMEFVYDVIDEVCELFPSEYFHIGGDEAPRNEWKKCPCCQQRIKDEGLKNENELQGWFSNSVYAHLKERGKTPIGWNEILKSDNIDKDIIAQYWTPKRDKNAEKYVKNGGRLLMSNHQAFYFDMTYAQYPLKNTYDFTPAHYGITSEGEENIIGVEGEAWTEWIDGREKLDLNLHPRAQALAEVAWSPYDKMDWDSFLERLNEFKPFFDKLGINYAVDKIAMPSSLPLRTKIKSKFMNGDTHLEVKLNNEYKAQGER